jgi:EAL domain-containing protein (putative c-di-GMP-specific phosphodiesterase class I)/GGDEF domain-containing protein
MPLDFAVSFLDELFVDLKRELTRADQTFYLFSTSPEALGSVLDKEKMLLTRLLEAKKSEMSAIFDALTELFLVHAVPFSAMTWNIDNIRAKLIHSMAHDGGSERVFILAVNDLFEELKNYISKAYIGKIDPGMEIDVGPFADKSLLAVHRNYVESVIAAIRDDDIDALPMVRAQHCRFTEMLDEAEVQMVCLDANLCLHLTNLHKIVHETLFNFSSFYRRRLYQQAYIVLREFFDTSWKLQKVIAELYYTAYLDIEKVFFSYIRSLAKEGRTKYITTIDILGLKRINDLYGHEIGDAVIEFVKKEAQALTKAEPKNALFVKGVVGDNYLLHLDYDEAKLKSMIESLASRINGNVTIGGRSVEIECVIAGLKIEAYRDLSEMDIRRILDYLTSEAKRQKERVKLVFDLGEKRRILAISNKRFSDLLFVKKSLKERRIRAVYQPIFELSGGRLAAVEALARIEAEEKLIAAGIFIDTIYELGMATEMDMQMLDIVKIEKTKISELTDTLFINAAAQSFMQLPYRKKLKETVEHFAPEVKVVVEITEQSLLETIEMIQKIKQRCVVTFAADDFGTGFTSLKTVVDLAEEGLIEYIKIDGMLVRDIADSERYRKVVEMIAMMGKRLDLGIIAEYIENNRIESILKRMQVDYGQGYLFCYPDIIENLLIRYA